jgi:hypothetical protein
MIFKDHFAGHADPDNTDCPADPQAIFPYLASLAPRHDLAWDCATGNGQAAIVLSPFFRIPARLDIISDVGRFESSCPSGRLAILD